jgi:hypothetical protein
VGATAGLTDFAGVETSAPIETADGLYSANTKLIAAPSLTTWVDGSLVLGWYGNSAANSVAPPSGMSESFDVSTAQSNQASTSESASEYQENRGPTGYQVAMGSSKAKSTIGQSVALTPLEPPPADRRGDGSAFLRRASESKLSVEIREARTMPRIN